MGFYRKTKKKRILGKFGENIEKNREIPKGWLGILRTIAQVNTQKNHPGEREDLLGEKLAKRRIYEKNPMICMSFMREYECKRFVSTDFEKWDPFGE